jgi:SAM-dependent methyltransferase
MEMEPTLAALSPFQGMRIVEFGCGGGRYTVRLAPAAKMIVAIDYSLGVLRQLASRADPAWPLALVQADCCTVVVKSASFDRALSTLTSNLPSRRHRLDLFQQAARALRSDGKFVHSAHNYGLTARLKRSPRSGYYDGHHIFRYLSGRSELKAETQESFHQVTCRPISVVLPFGRRLGYATAKLSGLLERVPGLNEFGDLLLVVGELPNTKRTV